MTEKSHKIPFYRQNVEMGERLKQEILTKVRGALVDTEIGEDGNE